MGIRPPWTVNPVHSSHTVRNYPSRKILPSWSTNPQTYPEHSFPDIPRCIFRFFPWKITPPLALDNFLPRANWTSRWQICCIHILRFVCIWAMIGSRTCIWYHDVTRRDMCVVSAVYVLLQLVCRPTTLISFIKLYRQPTRRWNLFTHRSGWRPTLASAGGAQATPMSPFCYDRIFVSFWTLRIGWWLSELTRAKPDVGWKRSTGPVLNRIFIFVVSNPSIYGRC